MTTTGIVFEVKRFAVHDGPGVRTSLFFKGCPLRCRWCHNPEGISPQPQLAYFQHKCIHCGECVTVCPVHAHSITDGRHVFVRTKCQACGACESACLGGALRLYGKRISVDEAVKLAIEDRDFYGTQGGVTLSGGEPLMQPEFCYEFLTALKRQGIHTAVDTCGCVAWEAMEKILPVTDLFLFDFKHADSTEHRKLTGQGNERILDNLQHLVECQARVQMCVPLVPGCNDSENNLMAIGKLFKTLRIEQAKVLPYHAMARSKYAALGIPDTLPQVDPPSSEQMAHVNNSIKNSNFFE